MRRTQLIAAATAALLLAGAGAGTAAATASHGSKSGAATTHSAGKGKGTPAGKWGADVCTVYAPGQKPRLVTHCVVPNPHPGPDAVPLAFDGQQLSRALGISAARGVTLWAMLTKFANNNGTVDLKSPLVPDYAKEAGVSTRQLAAAVHKLEGKGGSSHTSPTTGKTLVAN